jgi:tRNA dimethylallyltransferase
MPLIAILAGPTASGKSALALRWARERGLEILSADSRQLYRGFTIGTGAPTPGERGAVPHHLVGHVDPREAFSPQRFRAEAQAIVDAHPEKKFLVVGGTGLYLKEWLFPFREDRGETPPEARAAAQEEIARRGLAAVHADLSAKDPEGLRGVDPHDVYRVQKRLESWIFTGRSYARPAEEARRNPLFDDVPFLWLDPERAALHARIEARIRDMFARGWIEEVRALRESFDPETTPAFNALGYREIAEAISPPNDPDGTLQAPSPALFESILTRTRRYAKKQTTFLRHQFPPDPSRPRSNAVAFRPEELAQRLESVDWDAQRLLEGKFGARND